VEQLLKENLNKIFHIKTVLKQVKIIFLKEIIKMELGKKVN